MVGRFQPQISKETSGNRVPVLIIAAGKGTRASPVTGTTPKSLFPVGDAKKGTLLYLIEQLKVHGIPQIAVSLGYQYPKILSVLKDTCPDSQDLVIFDARPLCEKGPLFSMLAASEFLQKTPLYALYPADTIFAPALLDLIVNGTYEPDFCHVFYFQLFNQSQNPSASTTRAPTGVSHPPQFELILSPPVQNNIQSVAEIVKIENKATNQTLFMVPVLILTPCFLQYAKGRAEQGDTRVIDVLIRYMKKEKKCKAHGIQCQAIPFFDFDSAEDLSFQKPALAEK